jgi:hypothetical protein
MKKDPVRHRSIVLDRLAAVIFFILVLEFGTTLAAIAASGMSQMTTMIGRFECITSGSSGPSWRFATSNSLYGNWLRLDATYQPQNGAPAAKAVTFLGFDQNKGHWEIVSVHDNGSFYSRVSTSRRLDGSHWIDSDPADGGKAVIALPGTDRYLFDLAMPAPGGFVRSRTACTRVN